jgi:hypothetical protein
VGRLNLLVSPVNRIDRLARRLVGHRAGLRIDCDLGSRRPGSQQRCNSATAHNSPELVLAV